MPFYGTSSKVTGKSQPKMIFSTVCFVDPLAFGVFPPFFSALTLRQDEEEVMGAAFRPSYWAQTLAKDAESFAHEGWVEGCCVHRKVVHILFGSRSCNIFDEVFICFHYFQKCRI